MIPSEPRRRDREVGLYLAIVFAITWGVAVVVLGFPAWFQAHFGPLTNGSPVFYLAVWAPTFAATGLTLASGGWRGLRDLLSGFVRWRAHPGWWLAAVGFLPVLFLLAQYAGAAFGKTPAPVSAWVAAGAALLNPAVWFLGPIGEELGWRGFLLPRLLPRFGPLGAAIAVGAIWMTWHIPAFLVSTLSQAHDALLVFIVSGIVISVFMTWIYLHTGRSILLAGVLPHLIANAFPHEIADYSWSQAAVMCAGALCLVAVVGPKLAKPRGARFESPVA